MSRGLAIFSFWLLGFGIGFIGYSLVTRHRRLVFYSSAKICKPGHNRSTNSWNGRLCGEVRLQWSHGPTEPPLEQYNSHDILNTP